MRKQFSSWFGLELAGNRGRIFNHNASGQTTTLAGATGPAQSVETGVDYAVTLNGVFQLATIDFLRRENFVNFYASLGYGIIGYNPIAYANNDGTGTVVYNNEGNWGNTFWGTPDATGSNSNRHDQLIPLGIGVKFKLSDRVALNLGHQLNLVDSHWLYGNSGSSMGRYSYTYGGLEFSLGSSSKADLTWHNPVSTLYDELRDPALRGEVEALKQRVSTLEGTVDELSRDSDGDGVSDKFDKCPNTPAGVQVDGSGCPIKFPEPQETEAGTRTYSNIQFEFDSSVLKTESYATLDRLSAELRQSGRTITLDGYASAEGSEAYNLQLSKDRANSVKTYLVNAGVDAAKVVTNGYGEANPVASNATEEGRVQNRRVEIK